MTPPPPPSSAYVIYEWPHSSDSFDEDADEYGDESMNQKISNVSGIVAPEVYQQKKKRRRLADKGTSTANVNTFLFGEEEIILF